MKLHILLLALISTQSASAMYKGSFVTGIPLEVAVHMEKKKEERAKEQLQQIDANAEFLKQMETWTSSDKKPYDDKLAIIAAALKNQPADAQFLKEMQKWKLADEVGMQEKNIK